MGFAPVHDSEGVALDNTATVETPERIRFTHHVAGPVRRGLIYGSCSSLQVFSVIGRANPLLGTLSEMLNAPKFEEVCKASDSVAARASAKAAVAKAERKVKAEVTR